MRLFKYLLFTLLLFILAGFQKEAVIDTVITTPIYKSYFSYKYKEPLYVMYKLHYDAKKESADRTGMIFSNDTKIQMATAKDYAGTGYDEGHLANAKDFSTDEKLEKLTFRYYNCLPQTANLNRGIWKHWETIIRKESEKDSILIICGGVFSNKKMGSVYAPDYCWKVTKLLRKDSVMHVLWFDNQLGKVAQCWDLKTVAALEAKTMYKIPTKY